MKKQLTYSPLLLITTLALALCTSCSKSVEKRFKEFEASQQYEKEPIIFAAVQKGDAEMVNYILESGISKVDVKDEFENTPLILAAKIGHVEVVKILIAAGANLRATDKHGEPLIHLVAESGEVEVMKVLLASGLKVDERSDATGPLLYAPDGNSGYSHDVKSMIERNGGSVSTFSGYQPIHSAAEVGNVEMVKFLISVGADPQAKDPSGRTPLDYVDKTSLIDKGDAPKHNKLAVVRMYNPDQQETPPEQRSRVPTNEELQQRFFGK